MNVTEINLAIAKLCGWEPCEPRVFLRHAPSHAFIKDGNYYGGLNSIPFYVSNLNAIWDAEKTVGLHDRGNHKLRVKWINALRSIVDRRTPRNKVGSPLTTDVDLMTADAAERAEALLKTIGKWVDEHTS